jgi:hypothetical protein
MGFFERVEEICPLFGDVGVGHWEVPGVFSDGFVLEVLLEVLDG